MKKENKLLIKKLTALFLSIALVVGMLPAVVKADNSEISCKIVDYEDTYYNGFNDDIAMATGTRIKITVDGESWTELFDETLSKEEGAAIYSYRGWYECMAEYTGGQVILKLWDYNQEQEIFSQILYTPKYVNLSKMPTLGVKDSIEVKNKSCPQYYRVDQSGLKKEAKVFTMNNAKYQSAKVSLYNDQGEKLEDGYDVEGNTNISYALWFEKTTEKRIVCVRPYYSDSIIKDSTLNMVERATAITSVSSDNGDENNVFYKGFDDDWLMATGTRINVKFDNGEDYTVSMSSEESDKWDSYAHIGDAELRIYKKDGAVYADSYLGEDYYDAMTTKLFTPTIKPLSEMEALPEGRSEIETYGSTQRYKYYRLTSGNKRLNWKISVAYKDPTVDRSGLEVELFNAQRVRMADYYQTYNKDTYEPQAFECQIIIPAGETRVVTIGDGYADDQRLIVNLTKEELDNPPTTSQHVDPTTKVTPGPETTTKNNSGNKSGTDDQIKNSSVAVKKVVKKKSAKKLQVKLKKVVNNADGYIVKVYKTKKNAKKNKKVIVKKTIKKNATSLTLKHKKLKKLKTVYVRVCAYKMIGGKQVLGKWSSVIKSKKK